MVFFQDAFGDVIAIRSSAQSLASGVCWRLCHLLSIESIFAAWSDATSKRFFVFLRTISNDFSRIQVLPSQQYIYQHGVATAPSTESASISNLAQTLGQMSISHHQAIGNHGQGGGQQLATHTMPYMPAHFSQLYHQQPYLQAMQYQDVSFACSSFAFRRHLT